MKWWEKHSGRFQSEVQIMNRKFPQFNLGEASGSKSFNGQTMVRDGQRYWTGKLKTNSGQTYTVVATYPEYYPGGEIKTYIISPQLSRTNHLYGDGHLCLYSNDHNGKGGGAGPSMTAVSYIGWTAAWLHAYEIYQVKGSWPENNFFNRV
ncbi:MAG: hypothetical protein HOB68_11030 [Candidatus Marinimicrobia bacterium]|jgi:hypothetical protein|nr:hypothetical protein [Candidatus Neomarinimicrobiota bacterium]MBT4686383.1 hypothetical protein [Candidatus Neomarinimicrobiota bacterium]